jgi:phosphoribosyl 1,2-cyclic phosphodiesterase
LIVSVVFFEPRPGIDHLSLSDAEQLISQIKPKKAILTHFGMTMLKAKPHIQAEELSRKLGIEVLAAYDGMTIDF